MPDFRATATSRKQRFYNVSQYTNVAKSTRKKVWEHDKHQLSLLIDETLRPPCPLEQY